MSLFLPKTSAIGIDLSDLSIKIAQIKKAKPKMVLASLVEKPIPKSFINDGIVDPEREEDVVKIIKETLKEVKGKKINTKKAICSLPEENSFIKIIQIPKTKEEDIEGVIKWQIESNFPVRLKDIYFDWEVIKSPEVNNKKDKNKKNDKKDSLMSVSVAVIPKKIVHSYFSIFKKAGIDPIAFEIESMAVVRAVIENYSSSPVIILDIGKCGTGLTIFSGNAIIFTSHIDISGQSFERSITKELKIDQKEAEVLKKNIGLMALKKETITNFQRENIMVHVPITEKDAKGTKTEVKIDVEEGAKIEAVFNSLVPILTDFSEQVQHYIGFFRDFEKSENIPTGKIEKIIVCGGDSRLIGLTEFFASSLKTPVEMSNLLSNICPSREIFPNPSFWQLLPYATVIGLAKRGASL